MRLQVPGKTDPRSVAHQRRRPNRLGRTVCVTSPLIPYPTIVVMQARWLIVERVSSEGIPHCCSGCGASVNTHKGARLSPFNRALLVKRAVHEGLRADEAAQSAGVSVRTAYKWLQRFRTEVAGGLTDGPLIWRLALSPSPDYRDFPRC